MDHNRPWKIQEVRIPDHLTCLLRNLYEGQEATVRTGHGITDLLQIRKGVCQDCILSPCLFNLYSECIIRKAGWMKHKLESRLWGRNNNNLRYADDTTLLVASEEELKSLLMKVKESEKAGLKSTFRKLKSWHLVPFSSVQFSHSVMSDSLRPHWFMANRLGNNGNCDRLSFCGLQNHWR